MHFVCTEELTSTFNFIFICKSGETVWGNYAPCNVLLPFYDVPLLVLVVWRESCSQYWEYLLTVSLIRKFWCVHYEVNLNSLNYNVPGILNIDSYHVLLISTYLKRDININGADLQRLEVNYDLPISLVLPAHGGCTFPTSSCPNWP